MTRARLPMRWAVLALGIVLVASALAADGWRVGELQMETTNRSAVAATTARTPWLPHAPTFRGDGAESEVTGGDEVSRAAARSPSHHYDDRTQVARASARPGGYRLAPNTAGLNLPFRDAGLRPQVDDVVRHFDEFGTPPSGVRQGIRSGGQRGVFQNVAGTLPRHTDPRYYTEMDVWAGTGPRGTERLVMGRGGEVYYSPNHYESFVRVR